MDNDQNGYTMDDLRAELTRALGQYDRASDERRALRDEVEALKAQLAQSEAARNKWSEDWAREADARMGLQAAMRRAETEAAQSREALGWGADAIEMLRAERDNLELGRGRYRRELLAQTERADAFAARLEAAEAARRWGAQEVESIAGLSETPAEIRLDLLRAAEAIRRGEVL